VAAAAGAARAVPGCGQDTGQQHERGDSSGAEPLWSLLSWDMVILLVRPESGGVKSGRHLALGADGLRVDRSRSRPGLVLTGFRAGAPVDNDVVPVNGCRFGSHCLLLLGYHLS